jgi:hypothetical protein
MSSAAQVSHYTRPSMNGKMLAIRFLSEDPKILVLGVAAAQGTANNISQTEGPMRDRASDFSTKPRQLP